MDGILREGIREGAGAGDQAARYDPVGRIGIADHVADQVARREHAGGTALDAIHGVGADNIIGDRARRRATNDVVANGVGCAR